MTIDEAIAKERQLEQDSLSRIGAYDEEYSLNCKKWANEHKQITEWLEELKQLRKFREDIEVAVCKYFGCNCVQVWELNDILVAAENKGYNKAIDDFTTLMKDIINKSSTGHIRVSAKDNLIAYNIDAIVMKLKEEHNNDK